MELIRLIKKKIILKVLDEEEFASNFYQDRIN